MNPTSLALRASRDAVLVVSGEPSGDRIAADIARALAARGAGCFGMGGRASADAGVEIVSPVGRAAMGLTDVAAQLPRLLAALNGLVKEARRRRPVAAVLVDYTEFNVQLGRRLRAMGVRVLWCVAPQVWAWRPRRTRTVRSAFDRLAVILPFERALWQAAGADVHYVGHPALDAAAPDAASRAALRDRWGIAGDAPAIALLPGSRPHEVRRHLGAMIDGVQALARERPLHARLLLAGGLDEATRRWAAGRFVEAHVVHIGPGVGAASALAAFDAAVVASGTATLESALAGAPPVIVHRASALTAWAARRMLQVKHVGLPNLLLDRAPYPELLQEQLHAGSVASALRSILDDARSFAGVPALLRAALSSGLPPRTSAARGAASTRMAQLLDDWLEPRPPPDLRTAARPC